MADPASELRTGKPAASAAEPGGGLHRLDAFLGEWDIRGRALASPFGPDAPIAAHESYEWLPGDHFMLMRFDGIRGDEDIGCVEIIGEAPHVGHGFCAHAYYNDGARRIWRVGERNGVWIRTGEEMTGSPDRFGGLIRTRCTTTLSPDGESRTGLWEYSTDGQAWTTFWDVTARHKG